MSHYKHKKPSFDAIMCSDCHQYYTPKDEQTHRLSERHLNYAFPNQTFPKCDFCRKPSTTGTNLCELCKQSIDTIHKIIPLFFNIMSNYKN